MDDTKKGLAWESRPQCGMSGGAFLNRRSSHTGGGVSECPPPNGGGRAACILSASPGMSEASRLSVGLRTLVGCVRPRPVRIAS